MRVIADSSSTRTEWALVDGSRIVEQATTTGLNPFFQTRREISHIIRLELPEKFFRRRWDHIFFYGAGCNSPQKNKVMESSIVAQFKTPVTVSSNLLGAARGLLGHESGLACILGTGSNSCLYDGKDIVQSVSPLGYVLGDEGSNSYLGKQLVADILRGFAPIGVRTAFFEKFDTTSDEIMDNVYSQPLPNRSLARYASVLADLMDVPYVRELLYNAFMAYFRRNISFYDYEKTPLSFVGSTAVTYKEVLLDAARDFGATVRSVCLSSLPGLIDYHANLR